MSSSLVLMYTPGSMVNTWPTSNFPPSIYVGGGSCTSSPIPCPSPCAIYRKAWVQLTGRAEQDAFHGGSNVASGDSISPSFARPRASTALAVSLHAFHDAPGL